MEFLKKNWAKITIAVLTFLAGLVYLIAFVQTTLAIRIFEYHAAWIAGIVFFWGVTAYLVCKMLDQDWAKWVLLGTGLVGTVFSVAYLIYALDTTGDFFTTLGFSHAFTFLVVFGLIPLVKGIKKVVKCCCEEKAQKATPAAPKATAPKAAAK